MIDQQTHSPLLNREQAARYLLLTEPDATGPTEMDSGPGRAETPSTQGQAKTPGGLQY